MPEILIRGMEMPKSCGFCELRYFDGDADCCPFVGDACGYGTRHVDCPLHELPEHGDLIDRDALNSFIESGECNSVGKALQQIDKAPVVIPASSAQLHEEGRE